MIVFRFYHLHSKMIVWIVHFKIKVSMSIIKKNILLVLYKKVHSEMVQNTF